MAKLILHIGAHKTGTSYLQSMLFHNREMLERNNVFYPDIGPNPAHHILTTPWIDHPEISKEYYDIERYRSKVNRSTHKRVVQSAAGFFSSFRRLWREIEPTKRNQRGPDRLFSNIVSSYAHRPGTLFISAEPFSRAAPQSVSFADLADRTREFDEVEVIYVLRRQPELIQSIWLQLSKSAAPPDFRKFLSNALSNLQCSGLWLDHGRVLDMVLEGFSPEQIKVMDYDKIRHGPGGILGAFLSRVDGNLKPSDFSSMPREVNPSPDPLETYIASRISAPNRPSDDLTANVAQMVSSLRIGRRTMAYTAEEYSNVLRTFAPYNAALTGRLQAIQPGLCFDIGLEPPSDVLWRDMIDTSSWLALVKSMCAT